MLMCHWDPETFSLVQLNLACSQALCSQAELNFAYIAHIWQYPPPPPPLGPSRDGHNQDSYPAILLIKEL